MLTQRQATTRVKRGVELLDRVNPEWFKKINLKKFQLDDTSLCVLGQVYKNFHKAVSDLAKVDGVKLEKPYTNECLCGDCRLDEDTLAPEIAASYYGFNVKDDSEEQHEQFEILGQTWVRAINRKRTDARDASRFAA
jgi:hypothetical protein